jgi:2-keto-4-pentenoate hydratase/2-oxohepta-3-ene-1,7-dioic acid hydratase in catechol pathway
VTQAATFWQDRFGLTGPGKIVCVGLNYQDHATEGGVEPPDEPLLFAKFGSSLIGPDEPIVIPPETTHVDGEAELAVVIGKRVHRVSESKALDAVAGYTAANDVSARDLQFKDGQWLRGKSFDTFCPVLTTTLVPASELGDARGLRVIQRVNNEVLQYASTDDLIFGIPRLIAHASNVFTLEPGDLILTGTPPGVGYFRDPKIALADGDVVEVEVDGIGVLSNPVRADASG